MDERALDVETVKRRIDYWNQVSTDESIILQVGPMGRMMTEFIVHLWDAIAEVERLRAAAALHRLGPADRNGTEWCQECRFVWPCPTARAAGVE